MNVDFAFEVLGLIGRSLSVQETVAVTCSLKALGSKQGCKLQFWGKVVGHSGAYLLCQSVPPSPLDPVDTFFSVDGGTNWTKLAPATPDQAEFSEQLRGPLSGKPDYAYKLRKDLPPEDPLPAPEVGEPQLPANDDDGEDVDGAPAAAEDDEDADAEEREEGAGDNTGDGEEGEEDEPKPRKRQLKFRILSMQETARLAHFVSIHDAACRLVPRGAFLRNPDGLVVRNKTFGGLEVPQAMQLEFFFKLKEQVNVSANRDLFGPNFNLGTDFLTPATEDQPVGIWSNKFDPSTGLVAVENLFFPGSLFVHQVDTARFVQVYYGNGQRNLDLCFMLP